MKEPGKFLVTACAEANAGLRAIYCLDEMKITIKDVERIQRHLSTAASEMTKLRTWMVENLKPE